MQSNKVGYYQWSEDDIYNSVNSSTGQDTVDNGPFFTGGNVANVENKGNHNSLYAGLQSAQFLLSIAQQLINYHDQPTNQYIPASVKKELKSHLLSLVNKV